MFIVLTMLYSLSFALQRRGVQCEVGLLVVYHRVGEEGHSGLGYELWIVLLVGAVGIVGN